MCINWGVLVYIKIFDNFLLHYAIFRCQVETGCYINNWGFSVEQKKKISFFLNWSIFLWLVFTEEKKVIFRVLNVGNKSVTITFNFTCSYLSWSTDKHHHGILVFAIANRIVNFLLFLSCATSEECECAHTRSKWSQIYCSRGFYMY